MKIASGSADYLKRHWRGELPLWQAFWLSGVLPLCVPPVLTHVMPPEWLYNNAGNAGIRQLELVIEATPHNVEGKIAIVRRQGSRL